MSPGIESTWVPGNPFAFALAHGHSQGTAITIVHKSKGQPNCSPMDEYNSKAMLPFRVASNNANWGQSKPQLRKATKFGAIKRATVAFSPICAAFRGTTRRSTGHFSLD
jgi:hypothetical protein